MTDRTVSARLRLLVDDYVRSAKQAAEATREIGSAAGDAGRQATGMSRLADTGRNVGRAFASVATIGVGAMTAIGISTLRTGVAYNTLEQTSRAALTTVLGSAAAANDQMDRLREFGRSSPFPRQVWIEAQRTLLGFGMSAERIIPTLSAIQDAVAATGGSAQEISEIVRVLAQVQSTGRVTAVTLNQLGLRGVDAATLIGSAMGRTAQQIRDDISSGALDAEEFLVRLTDSMSTRFAGAAENVKETWVGATDRIAGAMRDIGSAAAETFIDPRGGGAAVVWANDVADGLRAFEGQLRTLVPILRSQADPALQRISDRLQAVGDAIANADVLALLDTMRRGAPVFAAFGAAIGVVGVRGLPVIGALAAALGPQGPMIAGLAALAMVSPELRGVLTDLLAAAAPLGPVVLDIGAAAGNVLTPTLEILATVLTPLVDLLGLVTSGFALLPAPIQTTVVALGALILLAPRLRAAAQMMTLPFIRFGEQMAVQRALAGQIAGGYQRLGDEAHRQAPRLSNFGAAAAVAGRGMSQMRLAASGAIGVLGGPWGMALTAAVIGLSVFAGGQRDSRSAVTDHTAALDEQTGALTNNNRELVRAALAGKQFRDQGGFEGETLSFAEALRTANVEMSTAVDATLGMRGAMDGLRETSRQLQGEVMLSADEIANLSDAERANRDAKMEQWHALLLVISAIEQEIPAVQDALETWLYHQDVQDESADAVDALTGAVEAQTNALRENADELRAQADPMFAMRRAQDELTAAQEHYIEVLEDSEATQKDVQDAALGVFDAALTLRGAVGDLAVTGFDGQLTPAMRRALEAAGVTEDQVDSLEQALAILAGEIEAYGRLDEKATVRLDSDEAQARIDRLNSSMANLQDKWVTVGVNYSASGTAPPPGFAAPFASGGPVFGPAGIDRVPAWLTAGEHVLTVSEVNALGGHQAVEALRGAAVTGAMRFARGGAVGSPAAYHSVDGRMSMVRLAPEDRDLLTALAGRPVELRTTDEIIARSADRGDRVLARRR